MDGMPIIKFVRFLLLPIHPFADSPFQAGLLSVSLTVFIIESYKKLSLDSGGYSCSSGTNLQPAFWVAGWQQHARGCPGPSIRAPYDSPHLQRPLVHQLRAQSELRSHCHSSRAMGARLSPQMRMYGRYAV
jgi:hypothetical protein